MPRYTKPRKTWEFTKDFKVKAVKLSLRPEFQVKQVAEGLDIRPFMLSCWRKEYREGNLQGGGQRRIGVNKSKTVRLHSGLEYLSPVEHEQRVA